MSAFIVSKAHVDSLVTAALPGVFRHDGLGAFTWYTEDNGRTHELDYVNADDVSAMLTAENRASVDYRYDRESPAPFPYRFSRVPGPLDPVAVLKAIECFEYQSCEHPEWRTSSARAFCQRLRVEIIRHLPGYSAAPWEIDNANQARARVSAEVA